MCVEDLNRLYWFNTPAYSRKIRTVFSPITHWLSIRGRPALKRGWGAVIEVNDWRARPAIPSGVVFMIRTKSVHSVIEPESDGLRILATRFRGRGMRRERYDVWMPNLGPSETLLRDMQAGRISWADFIAGYREEMFMDGPVDARSATIKNHGQKFTLRLLKTLAERGAVTVMCHCAEDERHCHRHELARILASRRI